MRRRPAVPDDLDLACAVAREGIGPWLDPAVPPDEAAFRRGIAERLAGAEVVERDGRPIGWMRVLAEGPTVKLDQLYLAASVRGRGLGTALVRQVIRAAGTRPVELRVLKANPAIRLYRRLGFRVDGDAGAQWHLVREGGWDGPIGLPAGWTPGAAELHAVRTRLGLAAPTPLPQIGSANHVYVAGDVVLRVATATADGLSDARTEASAVPPAVAAGVRTPALLAFDETGRDVPVPFTAYARAVGALDETAPAETWREVGRELAKVHAIRRVPDGARWLDDHRLPDLRALLPHASALGDGLPERLGRWLDGLAVEEMAPVFLHGDLHVRNVLVRDGRLAAILDWGDAGWGDPALDFEPMPTRRWPDALAGYREAGGAPGDPTLEARVQRAGLAVALLRIARPKPRGRPTAKLEEWLACSGG